MKIWTSEYTFNYPWETVANAAWRKYPNPMNPAVTGADVLDRRVEDGVLYTRRLVLSKWYFPTWASSFVGNTSTCYASEYSKVDPKLKRLVLKTTNISLCNYISLDETLTYAPDPKNPSTTLLKQEAIVTVQGMPLSNYVENVLTSRISLNAGKGRQAIEWVIGKIEAEVKELKNSAILSTDELIAQTKKSIDDFATSAKKSMDEISNVAKNTMENLANELPPEHKLPKF